jgi:Nitrile hydratase beta subunit, N-terminal
MSGGFEVLMATLSGETHEDALPALDHAPAPWERNQQATCECLSWRGALENLERRHAEDELGTTVYADFPVHSRSVVVTAHQLIDSGAISEQELERKMDSVRARFNRR